MHIAKLCSDIQHNAPTFNSSIIQTIEKHLFKQNKHKESKKKQQKQQQKPHNFKPRFQLIEHPPTSPPYTATKTDTDLHHQIIITHLNTAHPHPHLHPYSHSKLQPVYHTTYHPNQLTKLSQIRHTNLHLPQPSKLPILTNNANPHLSTPHNHYNTLPTTHVTNTTKISTHYSTDINKPTP